MASPAYLHNGIVLPSHPIDSSIYYISLFQLTHTLYIIYTGEKSNQKSNQSTKQKFLYIL